MEPAGHVPEVASTLIHQILSVIAERGGIRARPLYELLCGPGPFAMISVPEFALLLKHLGSDEIRFVEQAPDGTIMLAEQGEAIVQSRNFFAVFESAEEWRLTVSGRTLGTLPISFPVHKDSLVVFAGQRWIVQDLDEKTNTLFVAPHPGGVVPRFERADGERLHDRLAAEMRAVYLASDEPAYLDERARVLLAEGREAFRSLELEKTNVLQEEKDVHVFLWRGSQVTAVFGAAAAMVGLPGHVHDLGLTLSETTVETARSTLASLADVASDAARVAGAVQTSPRGNSKIRCRANWRKACGFGRTSRILMRFRTSLGASDPNDDANRNTPWNLSLNISPAWSRPLTWELMTRIFMGGPEMAAYWPQLRLRSLASTFHRGLKRNSCRSEKLSSWRLLPIGPVLLTVRTPKP
ncbi:hypothetical protein ABIE89_000590 [Bradyrhizobium niftali]